MSRNNLPRRRVTLDKGEAWIGGVCAGFGRFWRIDPIWVRIATVTAGFMFPQLVVALYAACWLVMARG